MSKGCIKNNTCFFDRLGNTCFPDANDLIKSRTGAFFILSCNDAVLLTYPHYAPLVPDLPGGGVDSGETLIEAACRELIEETTLELPANVKPDEQYQQHVKFYADDLNEYWHYDQTFFLIRNNVNELYFEGEKTVPEGVCAWIPITKLCSQNIHFMHRKALDSFYKLP